MFTDFDALSSTSRLALKHATQLFAGVDAILIPACTINLSKLYFKLSLQKEWVKFKQWIYML